MLGLAVVAVLIPVTAARSIHHSRDDVVRLVRLPPGGIQPQAAVDDKGVVHVVYFAGEPAAGDLFYAQLANDGTFSKAIRVNSEAGSAIATGTVRGARLAVGRPGRVHVAWNGSSRATPKTTSGSTPMLYARMNEARTGFEPQRNVLQFAVGIDGGGAVAADARGRVIVAWHAGGPDSRGEGDRRVWLAESADDGRTFARERAVSSIETGACGCCGMDGLINARGEMFLLYRSAREVMNRDSYLLASKDAGKTFRTVLLQRWGVGACPMSTYDLVEANGVLLAAWETGGQVQYARVDADIQKPTMISPSGAQPRRHPSLAVNARGEVLMAWSEGTGWNRGGAVAWQVFDQTGRALEPAGRAAGMPVWGLSATIARPDGGFTIIY
ncbi:MAG TPA: hypothetical protein VES67_20295 [Vicinamibacterales bacterium]|nr:hypothetical protein [Vicinamibacterales bacterium]